MRVLDLFCGAGGAAWGIHLVCPDAEITGIDIIDQPEYPFGFRRGDVMELTPHDLAGYDFIWASPPCQRYSMLTRLNVSRGIRSYDDYPDLIAPVRKMLSATANKPYVIENVPQAPFEGVTIELNGVMFGLKVIRSRRFELHGFFVLQPPRPRTRGLLATGEYASVYGQTGYFRQSSKGGLFAGETLIQSWQRAMGIDWMTTRRSLAQAIPPAYSAYIFSQFMYSQRTRCR